MPPHIIENCYISDDDEDRDGSCSTLIDEYNTEPTTSVRLSETSISDDENAATASSSPHSSLNENSKHTIILPSRCINERSSPFSRVNTISPPRSRSTSRSSPGLSSASWSPSLATSSKTSNPSASVIRSRLLNRLGISSKDALEQIPTVRSYDSSVSILGKDVTSKSFEELLKADSGKPDVYLLMKYKTQQLRSPVHQVVRPGDMRSILPKDQQEDSNKRDDATGVQQEADANVRFDLTVKVHTIPNRTVYSDRIRATLWTDPIEMQQNAARNSLEYEAEGWDWTQVADDDDMVVMSNGERIHPIHFIHNH
jgi:hypothetical protein